MTDNEKEQKQPQQKTEEERKAARREYYEKRNSIVRDSKQQFKTLMSFAITENRVPWQKDLPATREPPHNPVTKATLNGNNLIQAVLHQDFIKTNDPRYITEKQLKEQEYKIKPDAVPLKLEFSNKNEAGKWESKIVNYYNASQVYGVPEYKPPERESRGTVKQAKCDSVEKQFSADMASFMTAISSGKEFKPQEINRDNAQIKAMTQPELMRLGFEAKNISAGERYNQLTRQHDQQQERKQPQKAQGMAVGM